jgi:hypothetical protein
VEQLKACPEDAKAKQTQQERAIAALNTRTLAAPGGSMISESSCAASPSAPRLDSRVVSDFPREGFEFLWRRSRDGFGARDLNGRCDCRANTLKLIPDTGGNVFDGFTPLSGRRAETPNATTV